MSAIPAIETDRLVLRDWREEDLDAYASMVADSEVMHYLGGSQPRDEAWRGLAMMLGHWTLRGFGLWAVTTKPDDLLIGRVGVQYPAGWPGREVTWMLSKSHWGFGYATEAAAAATRFAFALNQQPLIALIHPENMASRRVAERLGFRLMRTKSFDIYGQMQPREEWRASNGAYTPCQAALDPRSDG